MTSLTVVQDELRRLHWLVATLVAIGALTWLGIATFALYQVHALNVQQNELETLTTQLCGSLRRAGILIEGTERQPCGP